MKIIVYSEKFPLERAHSSDAGFDIKSIENTILRPGEVKAIKTGVYLVMPEDQHIYAQIFGRSSLAARGIDVFGGVIDAGYRGEIIVVLYNASNENVLIKEGDKIAQIIFLKLADVEISMLITEHAKELALQHESERMEKGFGSSGR